MISKAGVGKCRVEIVAVPTGYPPRYNAPERRFTVEREGSAFASIRSLKPGEWVVNAAFADAKPFRSFHDACTFVEEAADAHKAAS